jgi:hypothetical protein
MFREKEKMKRGNGKEGIEMLYVCLYYIIYDDKFIFLFYFKF